MVRDLINQLSVNPPADYCVRVTSKDTETGDTHLRQFQDNEKTLPTILKTTQKLSTGVYALNIRNIVLMRPVNNMIEFKQIIGRGTRLFEDKFYFTVVDFVGASANFSTLSGMEIQFQKTSLSQNLAMIQNQIRDKLMIQEKIQN